jgi:type VI secretion system protein ImpA
MANEPTIDIEALLAPVSEDSPAGTDPRGAPEWAQIKQARQSHGENDPFGATEVMPADWGAVIKLGSGLLASQGKHIELACDLTEALVHKHGFPGLRDGLRLIRELQARYWEGLFPTLDTSDETSIEESLLDRCGPLNGLNTNIVNAIATIPVTRVSGDNYSWLLYNDSRYVENVGRKDPAARAQLIADGRPDPEAVDAVIAATPWQFYGAAVEAIEASVSELKQLDDLIDEKYAPIGDEGPTLQGIRQTLEECQAFFGRVYRQKKPVAPGEEAAGEEAGMAAGEAVPSGPVTLAPRDRGDAIRRLRAVAEFFQRTEPHSPVAYLVQRAANWGEMSLEQWLAEVIKDSSTLGQLRETLGIKPPEGEY